MPAKPPPTTATSTNGTAASDGAASVRTTPAPAVASAPVFNSSRRLVRLAIPPSWSSSGRTPPRAAKLPPPALRPAAPKVSTEEQYSHRTVPRSVSRKGESRRLRSRQRHLLPHLVDVGEDFGDVVVPEVADQEVG